LPLTIHPGDYPYLELLTRITHLYTHLQAADYRPGLWGAMDTHLVQSPIYQMLGPAEKSTVATFVGFVMAKLFADRLLDIPWLFKFDVDSRATGMFGLNREFQWVTPGVKGRSNRLEQRLVKKAKKLTRQVTIGGRPPQQRVAFFSYFTAVSKTLKAYLVNLPFTAHDSNLNVDIEPDTFLHSYYALIFDFLTTDYGGKAEAVTAAARAYRVKRIPEADVQIGLNEQIYQLMQTQDSRFSRKLVNDMIETTPQDQTEPHTMIGPDGVFIRLDEAWGENRMHLPPEERNK
jgi:hypothetical protein